MKNEKNYGKFKKVGKKSNIPTFLCKLYQILENSENHFIVTWTDNGKAFVVKNLTEFIDNVLPIYFKHNNFASFVRQLKMYDFHKSRNSLNENIFFHKIFTKGQRHLFKFIKRKINKNNLNMDHSEYDESEIKFNSMRNLEDAHFNLLKNLDEVTEKQKQLEERISLIENENQNFILENEKMLQDILDKECYTKKMEVLILFLSELIISNHTKQSLKPKFSMSSNLNNIHSILKTQPNITLKNICLKFDNSDKAEFLFNMLENMNGDIIKIIFGKLLERFNLKFDDFNYKFNKDLISENFKDKIWHNSISKHNNIKIGSYELSNSTMSSPVSLVNTNEIITNQYCMNQNEEGSGHLKLNQKEKDTLFNEINRLTPCLILSPNVSPTPPKLDNKSESSILKNSNKMNQDNYQFEDFKEFSLQDIQNKTDVDYIYNNMIQ